MRFALSLGLTCFFWITVAIVIAAGLFAAIARYALPPTVERWKPEIQQLLSEQFQRPIEIGGLELAWRDHGFALSLTELDLGERQERSGHQSVARVLVRLDALSTLWAGRPVFDGLLLERLRLEFNLEEDNAGPPKLAPGTFWSPKPGGESEPAFSIESIELVDAEIVVRGTRFGDGPLRFSDLDLSLRREDKRYRFGANVVMPAAFGERVMVIGQIDADNGRPDPRRGALYVDTRNLNLAMLRQLDPRLDVVHGSGELELWADWSEGRLQRVDAEIALSGLETAWGATPVETDAVEGRLLWVAEEEGWTLSGDWLRLLHQGRETQVPGYSIRVSQGANGRLSEVRGEIRRVSANMLGHVFRGLPGVPKAVVDYVEASRPEGDVGDLRFHWQGDVEGDELPLRLRARLEGLAVKPVGRFPGVDELSGDLIVRGDRAWFDTDSTNVNLDAPHAFAKPLALDALRGRVLGYRHNGGWVLESRRLEAVSASFSTASRFHLRVEPGGHPPFVDLQTAFYKVDGRRHAEFLPLRVFRPRLVHWLSRAIVRADIPAGAVLLRGPLRGLPYRHGEGTFLAAFAVQDGILEFHPRWPRAEELDFDVEFRGAGFSAEAETGRIMELQANRVRAGIPNLREPVVHLKTGGDSGLPALLDFIDATPLAERVGSRLGPLDVEGEASVAVDLTLPLKTRAAVVAGIVELHDSQVSVHPWRLELDSVNGAVAFTEKSVFSEELTAELKGEPLRLGISTERADGGQKSITVVKANGRIAARDALENYLAWLAPYVEGRSDWQAEVSLGPEDGRVALRLKSQLAGTTVKLPAPVGKDADTAVPTDLYISTSEQPGVLTLRLAYGLNLRFAATVNPTASARPLQRGVLHFGSGEPEFPKGEGLHIGGTVDELLLDDWLALFPREEPEAFPPWLHSVDLGVGLARKGDLSIENLVFEADSSRWRLVSEDPRYRGDAAGGFPILSQPVEVSLQTLAYESGAMDRADREWMDPKILPPLRVQVDSLVLNGEPVGSLEFESERTADGLTIPNLRSESENHTLDAVLSWDRGESGDRSAVQIELAAADTGEALRSFGIYSDVDGAEGNMQFDAEWRAPLPAPDLETVEGSFSAELGPGRLVEVRPGMGKLMGMFNLYDVGRRLQLDFRDLKSEGFVFDSISAQARLGAGNVYDDSVLIKGPAASIEISGRVGLVDRDYDQQIVVTPEVSSTLPVAGLIAGGPIVGAAMLIAGKVFEEDINRVAQVEYSLTGSWEDPVFEMIKVEGLDMNDPVSKGGDQ